MSLLADVKDIDCVASLNPLRFDLGSTYVTGPDAIMRRILWRWCQLQGLVRYAPGLGVAQPLIDLPGTTFSPQDLSGLRMQLIGQARVVEFVTGVSLTLSMGVDGAVSIKSGIKLIDQRTYTLEVGATAAREAFAKIGVAA